MKMKKYYASSIPEAMKQVRAELGEDAVILNSKVVITKKFFGMIKKKSFEVVAGIDAMEPQQVASVPTPAVLPVVKKRKCKVARDYKCYSSKNTSGTTP